MGLRWFGIGGGGGGGGGAEDRLLWQEELRRCETGEFSMAVAQANEQMEDQCQVMASASATLVGVYDGHRRADASRFLGDRCLRIVNQLALECNGISEGVIRRAVATVEEQFLQHVIHSQAKDPDIVSVGSCCLLGAIASNTLYVANVGDSRAVLGRQRIWSKEIVAERLSTDHNVADENVRNELRARHPDDDSIVSQVNGVWRVKSIIQISRSIGDFYLKKRDMNVGPVVFMNSERPILSSEPVITARRLTSEDLFVIFASDGLWDNLSDEQAVNIVSKYPRRGIATRLVRAALSEAARRRGLSYNKVKLFKKGDGRRDIHDDTTVIVVYLDGAGAAGGLNAADQESVSSPVDVFTFNSTEGNNLGVELSTSTRASAVAAQAT